MASVKPTQQFSRWLSDATPSEDKAHSCSPVCCNLSCSAHGDLATEYEGASTGWEIVSRAFAKFRASSALGTRKLLKRLSADVQSHARKDDGAKAAALHSEPQPGHPARTRGAP